MPRQSDAAKPKLLFLAWNFPPLQAIGSVRSWNVTKHLARLGWDITVVTPRPELWRHVENAEKVKMEMTREGIHQISTDHRWCFLNPVHLKCWNTGIGWFSGGICRRMARRFGIDDGVGWIQPATQPCSRLKTEDVDLIFASGPPFSAFVLAEQLSKRFQCPYVLDYRDVWNEPSAHASAVALESKVLRNAAAITSVSPSLATDLKNRFNVGQKVHVVTNGYDSEDLSGVTPIPFDHFAIVYAGTFYPPERVATPVMEALKRIEGDASIRTPWRFHYYGDEGNHVQREAARLGLTHRVELHGRVSRSEVLSATRAAGLAVVITSVFENPSLRINSVPGKLFEVIGLGCPILLIAPPNSDAESIAADAASVGQFSGSDVEGMRAFISHCMNTRPFERKNNGRFAWSTISRTLDMHLRRELPKVSKFSGVSA